MGLASRAPRMPLSAIVRFQRGLIWRNLLYARRQADPACSIRVSTSQPAKTMTATNSAVNGVVARLGNGSLNGSAVPDCVEHPAHFVCACLCPE